MRIDSAYVGMESARSFTSKSQRTIMYSITNQSANGSNNSLLENAGGMGEDDDSFMNYLSKQEKKTLDNTGRSSGATAGRGVNSIRNADDQKSIETIKAKCVQYLIYWLFGGKSSKAEFEKMLEQARGNGEGQTANALNPTVTTINTSMEQYYYEKEETSFSTTGVVRTSDGREISFNLEMNMSRSFEEYYSARSTSQMVTFMDPLVINLDGNIAGLSDQKFEFDIDADGVKDSISMLNKGSGYLALDKNGDGIINDGSELFGTNSGDGFYDLSMYDEDGNGWIDENDEIFSKLLIWTKDENMQDQLYTLKEAGVGAICLQKVSTDFSLNNVKNNQTNGAIRNTGIFLYENGNAGTVQHLDVAR